ncbi:TNFAIP3-interacting protein 3 [Sorex araneus]|uniref:TNFAIP3-interacting protein 3 n=1 Tax=Sorex araneus TaxID=42254 RepID=UPI00243364B5|nr:TNFAIP3-interacting protein 3 [Sorex araneus]
MQMISVLLEELGQIESKKTLDDLDLEVLLKISANWFFHLRFCFEDTYILIQEVVREQTTKFKMSFKCESIELDNKIRDRIERNASQGSKGRIPEGLPYHRNSCSLQTPGKTTSMEHFVEGTTRTNNPEHSAEQTECAQSSGRKNLTNSLEQKIRCLEKQRKELLEVNQQWDQQFRNMKTLYEKKVTELKTKLDVAERLLSALEPDPPRDATAEPPQRAEVGARPSIPGQSIRDLRLQDTHLAGRSKEKEGVHKELHDLKKENMLLKEKNALANKKKEHYECEIKRLNKALQDALKVDCSSFPEHGLGKSEMDCSHEDLRTEMEVLKQQVQIYEEDFKKERSDRERLNQEKEQLQKINQTSQSQLNRLHFKIKTCEMEKEKLEKQLKQMYFPTCTCKLGFQQRDPGVHIGPRTVREPEKHPPDYQWYAPDQFPPDVQHKANGLSSEKKVNQ